MMPGSMGMRFKAKVIQSWKGEIIGNALVTRSKISFLGDIDMNTGLVVGKDLDIRGENVKDRVLIFPEGRGSTVGSNVLYGLARKGLAPRLIAVHRADPVTISGAVYGAIAMVSEAPEELFALIATGDIVRAWISCEKANLEVAKPSSPET